MTKIRVLKNNENLTINASEVKQKIVEALTGVNIPGTSEITTIFMNNVGDKHKSSKSTFYILFGATPGSITDKSDVHNIAGTQVYGAKKLEFEQDGYVEEMLGGSIYYSAEHFEVYVPYDLTGVNEDDITVFVSNIVQFVRTEIIDELVNIDSWLRTKDKASLQKRIDEYFKRDMGSRVREKERELESVKDRVESYRQELMNSATRIKPLMLEIEALRNGEVHGIDTFLKGLDLIAEHPRVSNLIVKENTIDVYVNDVIARVRIDRKDRFFYMGNMIIKIDIKRGRVSFDGDQRRKSYWSNRDVHPHISENGSPCLGNVEQTVIDLSQQLEVYPLFLMCLDYIQSVNVDDAAGRNVTNWDEVNEDGSPLESEKVEESETATFEEMVQVLMNDDGDFEQYTEEEAKEIATYIAYSQYIGYALDENLSDIEKYLSEGGEV